MPNRVTTPVRISPETREIGHTEGDDRPANLSQQLRRYLEAYWLRPENAFWMALRSHTLSRFPLVHPSIDLCCGDGVFSFLHLGGQFDPAFDVFHSVGRLDTVRDKHTDMFDVSTTTDAPAVLSSALDRIDVGTDLKKTLLKKAASLALYHKLVEHDNNQPLPFEDGYFKSVYCNAAYWVTKIDEFLGELHRITAPDGRIILQVKLDSMRKYTLDAHRHILGDRFLDIIDRGRAATWPTLTDRTTWEARFAAAGLSIVEATPFVTKTHAHIWDIGLRPIAPLLARMTQALSPDTRAAIKRDWVELFCELLTPICDPTFHLMGSHDQPAEIQYVLSV